MLRSSVVTAVLLGAAAVPCVAAYRYAHAPLPEPPPLAESATWAPVDQGPDFDPQGGGSRLQQVTFNRQGMGLSVGQFERIWRSGDGGRTWRRGQGPAGLQLGVTLLDDGRAFIAGRGPLKASSDVGKSWTPVDLVLRRPRDGEPAMAARVLHAADGVLIVVGDRVLGRSTDGGRTWTQLDVPPPQYYSGTAHGSTVLVVGGSGFVLRSADAGVTWSASTLESRAMLRAVAFADPATAVIVGTDGTILRSEDAGLTWAEVPSPTLMHLRGVAFADPSHGVIVGFHGTALVTHDGGRSWQFEETGTRHHLFDVAVARDGSPVAVGWFDTIVRRATLLQEAGHE